MRVIVIGAGIGGLSLAYRLKTEAAARGLALELIVLESSTRPGGNIQTERADGFLLEAGPNGFLDTVPEMLELIDELGLRSHVVKAQAAARHRFIYRRGRLNAAPDSPPAFFASRLLSVTGKMRLAMEPFVRRRQPAPDDDETVAEFGRRRLGRDATSALLDPFVSGVYAGDAERLSVAAALPMVAEMERDHGSLFNGMRARMAERKKAGRGRAALTSFRDGMTELIDALAKSIGPALRLGSRVRVLSSDAAEWRVTLKSSETLRADRLVIATPAYVSASLVEKLDADLAAMLRQIPFAPVVVMGTGFERRQVGHALDGFGFLVPRDQGLRVLGTIFCSSVYERRAADGYVLLRTFVGGSRDPGAVQLDDDALLGIFRREVGSLLRIQGDPCVLRIHRYPRGIPQYERGHAARVARILALAARHPGLHLAGNSYLGVSMNDCVKQATVQAPLVLGIT